MTKKHWSKFFWADWDSDEGLRQCSLAAQGLWMRMLCLCAKGEPVGYLTIRGETLAVDGIARAVGLPETEVAPLLAELERWAVFSRDAKQRIFSRRLTRDEQKANILRKNGEKGGRPPSENQTTNQSESNALASSSWTLERKNEGFEKFWKAYPKREGPNPKHMALKSFLRAAETEAIASQIIAGARKFAFAESKNIGTPYIAQAVTWLNQRRWEDYQNLPDSENKEGIWRFLLERERQTGSWPSRQIAKADIPREFIEAWEAETKEPAQ